MGSWSNFNVVESEVKVLHSDGSTGLSLGHLDHLVKKNDSKIQCDGTLKKSGFFRKLWLKQQNTTNNDDLRCRPRIESEHITTLKLIKAQKELGESGRILKSQANKTPEQIRDDLNNHYKALGENKGVKSAVTRHDFVSTHQDLGKEVKNRYMAANPLAGRSNDEQAAIKAEGERLERSVNSKSPTRGWGKRFSERIARSFHALGDTANGITTVSGTVANNALHPTVNPKSVNTKLRMILGAVAACLTIMVSGVILSNFITGPGGKSLADIGFEGHRVFGENPAASFFVGWFMHSMLWFGLATVLGLGTMAVSSMRKPQDLDVELVQHLEENKDLTLSRLVDYIKDAKITDGKNGETLVIGALKDKIGSKYWTHSEGKDVPKLWLKVKDVENADQLQDALADYLTEGDGSDSYRRERHVLALTNLVEHQRIPGIKDPNKDRTGRLALQEAPLSGVQGGFGLRKLMGKAQVGLGNLIGSESLKQSGKQNKLAADNATKAGMARRSANDAEINRPGRESLWSGHNHKILSNKHNYGTWTIGLAKLSEGLRFVAQAVVLSLDTNVGRVFGATFEKIADCMGSHPNRIMARRAGMFCGMALIGVGLSFLGGGMEMLFDTKSLLLGNAGDVKWGVSFASLALGCGLLLAVSLIAHYASKVAMSFEGHRNDTGTRMFYHKGAEEEFRAKMKALREKEYADTFYAVIDPKGPDFSRVK